MGLAKIGVVTALINFNLRQKSLLHTLTVAGCKAVIYGLDLENAIKEIRHDLNSANNNPVELYHISADSSKQKSEIPESGHLDDKVRAHSERNEPKSVTTSLHYLDPLFYIYTSGTTGLPKAVNISHVRQLFACSAAHYTIGLRHDDTIYCHLPLYHSSGGQVATASSLFFGAKTVIRKKFSASNFWKECTEYNVTVRIEIILVWKIPVNQFQFILGNSVHWRNLSLPHCCLSDRV